MKIVKTDHYEGPDRRMNSNGSRLFKLIFWMMCTSIGLVILIAGWWGGRVEAKFNTYDSEVSENNKEINTLEANYIFIKSNINEIKSTLDETHDKVVEMYREFNRDERKNK